MTRLLRLSSELVSKLFDNTETREDSSATRLGRQTYSKSSAEKSPLDICAFTHLLAATCHSTALQDAKASLGNKWFQDVNQCQSSEHTAWTLTSSYSLRSFVYSDSGFFACWAGICLFLGSFIFVLGFVFAALLLLFRFPQSRRGFPLLS